MLPKAKGPPLAELDPIKWASLPDWQKAQILGRASKKPEGLKARKPLQRRKVLRPGSLPREIRRTVTVTFRKVHPRTYLPLEAGAMWAKKRQDPIARESPSPATRERRRQIKAAKKKALAMWEGCGCIGAFLGPCGGHLEGMHGYSVGAHPELELAANPANILPGCSRHHRTGQHNFTDYSPWKKALQAAADLMLAADADRRPHPGWEELQGEITRVIAREEKKLRSGAALPERVDQRAGGDGFDEVLR